MAIGFFILIAMVIHHNDDLDLIVKKHVDDALQLTSRFDGLSFDEGHERMC